MLSYAGFCVFAHITVETGERDSDGLGFSKGSTISEISGYARLFSLPTNTRNIVLKKEKIDRSITPWCPSLLFFKTAHGRTRFQESSQAYQTLWTQSASNLHQNYHFKSRPASNIKCGKREGCTYFTVPKSPSVSYLSRQAHAEASPYVLYVWGVPCWHIQCVLCVQTVPCWHNPLRIIYPDLMQISDFLKSYWYWRHY